jgi:hypothetical protein
MGFRIEKGEFLSKTRHVAFSENEYDKLHNLLADKNSALAQYTINELVPNKKNAVSGVDAVSSATITEVLNYIVEGAVYTTYTLWHIVYGNTKREIEKLTAERMNPQLAMKLLESERNDDKVWVMNHLRPDMESTPEIDEKLLEIISGSDVYLAERALNSLDDKKISYDIQQKLVEVFKKTGFIQQRFILQKMNALEQMDEFTALALAEGLEKQSSFLIKTMLELFSNKKILSDKVNTIVAGLLGNENRFVSVQALKFLEKQNITDKNVLKKINKYKEKFN